MAIEIIRLNLIPDGKVPVVHCKQYDVDRAFKVCVYEGDKPYIFSDETVELNVRKSDTTLVTADLDVTSGVHCLVVHTTEQMCAVTGKNECEIRVIKEGANIGSLNFIMEIKRSPTEGGLRSDSEINNLQRQMEDIIDPILDEKVPPKVEELVPQIIGEDYYTAEETDEAIATAIEGKADKTYVDTELAKKADKTNTYTKSQVDTALNLKADKSNPTITGAISHYRRTGSTVGNYSVAFGFSNISSGIASFAEGGNTIASANNAHAEGNATEASARFAHAEGRNTIASAEQSHAEGYNTTASGTASHAEGNRTTASGNGSHAEGGYTVANHKSQHVFGEYNTPDDSAALPTARGNYVEIVGNGTSSSALSNARTLDWSGNEWLAGDLTFNGNKSLTSEISRLDNRITELPEAMVFKGTLGVNGDIQALPTPSASNEGWTFKCITAGTYSGLTLKVGDTVTCFNPPNTSVYEWDISGYGDTDTDTWRAIKVNGEDALGSGISSGSVDFVGSENIDVEFDSNGNKIGVKTKNIYTKTEVDDIVSDAIYNVLPDDTASGSVANFNTSLELPIKSLEVDVNAVQEAGTPTPATPLPISGWSEISLCQLGKNLFNVDELALVDVGATGDRYGVYLHKSGTFIVSGVYNGSVEAYIYARKKLVDGTFSSTYTIQTGAASTSSPKTVTVNEGETLLLYNASANQSEALSKEKMMNFQIEIGSSDTSFEPFNGTTEVIALGGTYYGGHFTQDKDGHRQLVLTWKLLDWNSLDVRRSNNAGQWNAYLFYAPVDDAKAGASLLSEIYVRSYSGSLADLPSNSTRINQNRYLYVRDDSFTDVQTFKNAMLDYKYIYELDTPIIIDLPDGEPITTLIGTNNIYADTGDTEVVFKDSVNGYVEKKIASVQALALNT